MATTAKPTSLEIRTYQVGFGDCFLLTFKYAGYDRHILIDFGSMALPEGAEKDHMLKVAQQIKEDCGGKLEIVVATHRHQDHISGFATNKKGNAPGNIIAACNPRMVVQPWTENPKAAKNAKTAGANALRAFTASLDHMNDLASAAIKTAQTLRRGLVDTKSQAVVKQLTYLGKDNIKNRSAVENLMTMGTNRYVKHGDTLAIAKRMPGVKIHVLGPPTLEQSGAIAKQRARDDEEFWHLQALAGARDAAGGDALFPEHASRSIPIGVRWFRSRMRAVRADTMLSIVRILDNQMNNTSVILLLEFNGKYVLFPGDAQIENWQYALSQAKWKKALSNVSLYKVGHHGSLNATPKTLWELFGKKGASNKSGRLKTLLSTLEGVHGHEDSRTEVPRKRLVNALRDKSDLLNTQSYKASELSRVVHLR